MDINILFEDNDCIVINKPPGMVVNRALSVKDLTVQDWAEEKLASIMHPSGEVNPEDKDFYDRAGFVHRIDKETSGILLIAKNVSAFHALQGQFKDRTIQKTYLALVHGDLLPSEGEIRAPVGRLPWNRERFGILPEGKDSVTQYKKLRTVIHGKSDEILSVVELHPHTGRTHQIRVHMQYIRHPLVGDYVYAGRKTSRLDRTWIPRIMLHAWKMTFTHPTTGQSLAIEAPIPDDMSNVINSKV